MLRFGIEVDNVDPVFAETQRGLDRFGEARPIFLTDRDAILNDLHARAEPFDFCFAISADDLAVDPNAQITLLLEEVEEIARLGFRRNGNPEGDQDSRWRPLLVIPTGAKRSGGISLRWALDETGEIPRLVSLRFTSLGMTG